MKPDRVKNGEPGRDIEAARSDRRVYTFKPATAKRAIVLAAVNDKPCGPKRGRVDCRCARLPGKAAVRTAAARDCQARQRSGRKNASGGIEQKNGSRRIKKALKSGPRLENGRILAAQVEQKNGFTAERRRRDPDDPEKSLQDARRERPNVGPCLTAAARESRSRHAVRGGNRYADARTFAAAIITAVWPGGIM